MIMESSKDWTKCSKSELILLLRAEIENRDKLIKLMDKRWDNTQATVEDSRFPMYESPEKKAFLDGYETAINTVRNFYGIV